MNREQILTAYLRALEQANYTELITLLADDAKVLSPLYGEQNAATFYQTLFQDTQSSELTLLDIFFNVSNDKACINFLYRWTMADGAVVEFDCVDIVEFDSKAKIKRLKIIYDTARARALFQKLKS